VARWSDLDLDLDPRPHRPTGVRTYYPVDDLTATLASVTGHGGAVATEPELISEEFGWYAVGTDPFGNRIGLCSGNPPTT